MRFDPLQALGPYWNSYHFSLSVQFVERRGTKIGCIEEIAFYRDFIDRARLNELALKYGKSGYGNYRANLQNMVNLIVAASARLMPARVERQT